ncbi:MAG: hypothetical protein IPK79_06635 [Vampirovibrionales bacterium]|nr:hypothetical protein [Vampirovibrionales bacterium]
MDTPGIHKPIFSMPPPATVSHQHAQQHQATQSQQQTQTQLTSQAQLHAGTPQTQAPVQTQRLGQVASFYNTAHPAQTNAGQPTEHARAAIAFDLVRRILKGEATAPSEKIAEMGALYEYFKKYVKPEHEKDHDLTEEDFKGLFGILGWRWFSREEEDENAQGRV